jgi:hypothetical protein
MASGYIHPPSAPPAMPGSPATPGTSAAPAATPPKTWLGRNWTIVATFLAASALVVDAGINHYNYGRDHPNTDLVSPDAIIATAWNTARDVGKVGHSFVYGSINFLAILTGNPPLSPPNGIEVETVCVPPSLAHAGWDNPKGKMAPYRADAEARVIELARIEYHSDLHNYTGNRRGIPRVQYRIRDMLDDYNAAASGDERHAQQENLVDDVSIPSSAANQCPPGSASYEVTLRESPTIKLK